MKFNIENIRTSVTADTKEIGVFGYFANDIASIRQTIETRKVNLRTVYARLDGVYDDKFERRFASSCGAFSLFYPTDKTQNEERY